MLVHNKSNHGSLYPSKRPASIHSPAQLSRIYCASAQIYRSEGYDGDVRSFIKQIAFYSQMPEDLPRAPLHSLLTKIALQLQFNNIELSLWSIFLDEFVWATGVAETEVLCAAFAAKLYLNTAAAHIEYYLCTQYYCFTEDYEMWISKKGARIEVDPVALNRRFSEFWLRACEEHSLGTTYNDEHEEVLSG